MKMNYIRSTISCSILILANTLAFSFEYSKHEPATVQRAATKFNLALGATSATATALAQFKGKALQPALYLTTFTALSTAWMNHKNISASK